MPNKQKLSNTSLSKKFKWLLSEEKLLAWWPAWWMMRLKVTALEDDWRKVRIILPLTWISRNAGGSMFGGFQALLADPIAPLACACVFKGYDVWTRRLTVDFRRPGNTDLELRFDFPLEMEEQIFKELAECVEAILSLNMACTQKTARCVPRLNAWWRYAHKTIYINSHKAIPLVLESSL